MTTKAIFIFNSGELIIPMDNVESTHWDSENGKLDVYFSDGTTAMFSLMDLTGVIEGDNSHATQLVILRKDSNDNPQGIPANNPEQPDASSKADEES